MRIEKAGKRIVGCLLAMLGLLLFCACAQAQTASIDVRIPMVATGAGCTAQIVNENNEVLQTVSLQAGQATDGVLTCNFDDNEPSPQNIYVLIRLADTDTQTVTYDKTVYEAIITLYTNDDDALNSTLEIRDRDHFFDAKKEAASFVNTVKSSPPVTPPDQPSKNEVLIDPPVRKQVVGNPKAAGTFTFTMSAVSGPSGKPLPMPNGVREQQVTARIVGAGEKEFGNISFTEPGTYVYRIAEVNTGESGYTYDDTVYTVTAVVTSANGKLSVEKKVLKGSEPAEEIVFTNTYTEPESESDKETETNRESETNAQTEKKTEAPTDPPSETETEKKPGNEPTPPHTESEKTPSTEQTEKYLPDPDGSKGSDPKDTEKTKTPGSDEKDSDQNRTGNNPGSGSGPGGGTSGPSTTADAVTGSVAGADRSAARTGDESRPALWMGILLAAWCMAVILLCRIRTGRRK